MKTADKSAFVRQNLVESFCYLYFKSATLSFTLFGKRQVRKSNHWSDSVRDWAHNRNQKHSFMRIDLLKLFSFPVLCLSIAVARNFISPFNSSKTKWRYTNTEFKSSSFRSVFGIPVLFAMDQNGRVFRSKNMLNKLFSSHQITEQKCDSIKIVARTFDTQTFFKWFSFGVRAVCAYFFFLLLHSTVFELP